MMAQDWDYLEGQDEMMTIRVQMKLRSIQHLIMRRDFNGFKYDICICN